jgi:HigB_toxin, RelE-like toxic component of a toxin-antitoxin system
MPIGPFWERRRNRNKVRQSVGILSHPQYLGELARSGHFPAKLGDDDPRLFLATAFFMEIRIRAFSTSRITKGAEWNSLADVRRDFAHADVVGRRTVFNIQHTTKRVFILHILMHADYGRGDWKR